MLSTLQYRWLPGQSGKDSAIERTTARSSPPSSDIQQKKAAKLQELYPHHGTSIKHPIEGETVLRDTIRNYGSDTENTAKILYIVCGMLLLSRLVPLRDLHLPIQPSHARYSYFQHRDPTRLNSTPSRPPSVEVLYSPSLLSFVPTSSSPSSN